MEKVEKKIRFKSHGIIHSTCHNYEAQIKTIPLTLLLPGVCARLESHCNGISKFLQSRIVLLSNQDGRQTRALIQLVHPPFKCTSGERKDFNFVN